MGEKSKLVLRILVDSVSYGLALTDLTAALVSSKFFLIFRMVTAFVILYDGHVILRNI